MACVEAEEIARLSVDLEKAIRTANGETGKRKDAEERLAAVEERMLKLKTRSPDSRTVWRSRRSRSPTSSPRDGVGGRDHDAKARGRVDGTPSSPEIRPRAGERAPEARGRSGDEGGRKREARSRHAPSRATGATFASRTRQSVPDRPARQNRSSVGDVRRSSDVSRADRGGEKGRTRPWASQPRPSRFRGECVDDASDATGRRRTRGDVGASPKRKAPPARYTNTVGKVGTDSRSETILHGDREWREGLERASKSSPCEAEESAGGGKRRFSVGRREVSAAGGGDSRRSSAAQAVCNARSAADDQEAGNDMDHRAEGAAAVEIRASEDGSRRERQASSVRHGKADDASDLDASAPDAGKGLDGASTAEVGATAAALLGLDISETVAREFRLAMSTATRPCASPASAAGFATSSTGENTPTDGGAGKQEASPVGDEVRYENPASRKRIGSPGGRHDGSEHFRGGLNPDRARPSYADGGPASISREVTELEGDIQHIFQIVAAKDPGRNLGRHRAAVDAGGEGRRGGGRVSSAPSL